MQDTYLVVLRCTMDDLPIKLHAEYGPALVQAQALGLRLQQLGSTEPTPEEVGLVEDVLGMDSSGWHSVCIYTFKDGVITDCEQIVDLT